MSCLIRAEFEPFPNKKVIGAAISSILLPVSCAHEKQSTDADHDFGSSTVFATSRACRRPSHLPLFPAPSSLSANNRCLSQPPSTSPSNLTCSMRQVKIFSGSSHPGLVDSICDRVGVSPAKAELGKFANGETKVQLSRFQISAEAGRGKNEH